MRVQHFLALPPLLLLATAAAAKPACEVFRFEVRQTISVTEYSELAGDIQSVDGGEGVIAFQPFDYEDAPVHGQWYAAGLITVSFLGIGGRPVGGVLWTNTALDVGSGPRLLKRNAANAEVTALITRAASTPGCAPANMKLELAPSGAALVNGRTAGRATHL